MGVMSRKPTVSKGHLERVEHVLLKAKKRSPVRCCMLQKVQQAVVAAP